MLPEELISITVELQLISITDTDFGLKTNKFCNNFGYNGTLFNCFDLQIPQGHVLFSQPSGCRREDEITDLVCPPGRLVAVWKAWRSGFARTAIPQEDKEHDNDTYQCHLIQGPKISDPAPCRDMG